MKKTKKPVGIIALAATIGFAMTACMSVGEKIAFDESLPDDRVALIHYFGDIPVVEYNGMPVKWKSVHGMFSGKSVSVKIPGGETTFLLSGKTNYTWGDTNYTFYTNAPLKYNYENGKEYTIFVTGHTVEIFDGFSYSRKNHIVTFRMSDEGQEIIRLNGIKITD